MTGHARRSGVLLRSVNPVRKSVIGDDVIELPGRLVVPGAPGATAVDGDDCPLVDAEDTAVGVERVDPQRVVIVAARRTLHRNERLSSIFRSIDVDVARIDDLGILRLDSDAAEVP